MSMIATQLLTRTANGDSAAAAELFPIVYENLRALASRYFRDGQVNQTLQPTAVVHEAFLKLVDNADVAINDRAHFFAIAATAMRQVLADHARRRRAAKRGGDVARTTLSGLVGEPASNAIDLIALDEALTRLALLDARQARLVELRFFGGLTHEEIAALEGVSTRTVEKQWRQVRAWLAVALDPSADDGLPESSA